MKPRPALLTRGGARKTRAEPSWQLVERDCRKLMQASEAAFVAGMPLNRFITIAWGKGGIDACESVRTTGTFIHKASNWLAGHGFTMPWVWVQECGNKFGQHCHILLHVDPAMDDLFGPMPLRWVKAILPGAYPKDTLESQKLATGRSVANLPAAYEAKIMGKLHYMMKTAPAELEDKLEMVGYRRKPWGQRCKVYGKRAGVWQGYKREPWRRV